MLAITNTLDQVRAGSPELHGYQSTSGRRAFIILMPLSPGRACYAVNFLPADTPAGHTYQLADGLTPAEVVEPF